MLVQAILDNFPNKTYTKNREDGMYMKKVFSLLVASLLLLSISGFSVLAQTDDGKNSQLTQEKKEELYNQYIEIVNEVAKQYPEEEFYINPLETFKDEDFMSPRDYKRFVIDFANSEIELESEFSDDISLFATGTAKKNANIKFGDTTRTITVTGTFTIDNFLGKMGFAGIKSMTSKAKDSRGTWKQIAYNGKILDAGETMDVSLSGSYTENGLTKNLNLHLEFYCSATGNIS